MFGGPNKRDKSVAFMQGSNRMQKGGNKQTLAALKGMNFFGCFLLSAP